MDGREIWMTEKYGGPRNIGLYVMKNAREILSEPHVAQCNPSKERRLQTDVSGYRTAGR